MSYAPSTPTGPDPYLPYGHTPVAPRPPLDGWSVASLVTALLGLVPVGLVTAVVGLSRTSGGRRRGRGLAVAGLVVSLAVGAVQVAVVAVLLPAWPEIRQGFEEGLTDAGAPDEAAPGDTDGAVGAAAGAADAEVVDPEVVDPAELTVGTCVIEPEAEVFFDVETVPCDRPHDAEVVAVVELEDRTWPGDDPVFEEAYDVCQVATTDALLEAGVDGDGLDPWVYTPTRESWVLYGDREATCVVYSLDDEPLTAPVLP